MDTQVIKFQQVFFRQGF